MEFFTNLLEKRRSTRTFTGRQMSAQTVRALLYAATKAPNACNFQSWHFYALDPSGIASLVPGVYKGEWIRDAAAAFVVCTEDKQLTDRFGERGKMFAIQDTAAAVTMLLLAAADLGWSGCWLGAFDPDACCDLLQIPDTRIPVAIVVVGEKSADVPPRDRKALEEVCTILGNFPQTPDVSSIDPEPFTLPCGNYTGGTFMDVNLSSARFDDVSLQKASFTNINLSGTKFADINLSNSSFAGVYMPEVQFGAADAESTCVEMNRARMTCVDLTEAVLKNCMLCNVELVGCDLSGLTIDGVPAEEFFRNSY